jgi:glycosyltransferase involved in cell wall biosynthesis
MQAKDQSIAGTTSSLKKQPIGIIMPLGSQQGGAEALLQHLLRRREQRFRYICAFLQDGPLVEEVRSLGYDTTVFPTTHLREIPNYLETVRALYRWLKQKQILQVVSWMGKGHLYASPAAQLAGVEAVWFQHGVSNQGRMDRITTLLPARAVLCCSETSRRAQEKIFPGRPAEVCYPGVSFPPGELLTKEEARKHLGLPVDTPIVGMVARWERWKGPHILIEVAQLVSAARPDATFFIVGGPHPRDLAYAEELRTMAAESQLGDRLILAGQRPPAQIPFWQASADVILHPVTGIEPFGMAVAEAMGMGKVVVASDLGGPAEIIQHEVNGILIPNADPNAFAAAIIRLLGDSERMLSLSTAAYLRGRTFSIEAFATRFENLLSTALYGDATVRDQASPH